MDKKLSYSEIAERETERKFLELSLKGSCDFDNIIKFGMRGRSIFNLRNVNELYVAEQRRDKSGLTAEYKLFLNLPKFKHGKDLGGLYFCPHEFEGTTGREGFAREFPQELGRLTYLKGFAREIASGIKNDIYYEHLERVEELSDRVFRLVKEDRR
jgi:hypothetical protein